MLDRDDFDVEDERLAALTESPARVQRESTWSINRTVGTPERQDTGIAGRPERPENRKDGRSGNPEGRNAGKPDNRKVGRSGKPEKRNCGIRAGYAAIQEDMD